MTGGAPVYPFYRPCPAVLCALVLGASCADATSLLVIIDGSRAAGTVAAPVDVNRLSITVRAGDDDVWAEQLAVTRNSDPLKETIEFRPGTVARTAVHIAVSGLRDDATPVASGEVDATFVAGQRVEVVVYLDWLAGVCLDRDGDGFGKGACAGSDCADEDRNAHPGADEVCNGHDDDCDGAADEAAELTAPRCSLFKGVCSSQVMTCGGAAGWIDCTESDYGTDYQVAEDRCDNLDNDCDGALDEGCPCTAGATRTCSGPDVGSCSPGNQECVLDGSSRVWGTVCIGEIGPQLEQCNGLDDDCDTSTDEDFDLETDPANCGGCNQPCAYARASAECVGGSCLFVACEPGYHDVVNGLTDGCEYRCDPTTPPTEICDGRDNDCDGGTDNALAPPACALTRGVCAAAVRSCGGSAGWSDCDYGATYQDVETICDGLDNDCDGETDEPVDVTCTPCDLAPQCDLDNPCVTFDCVSNFCRYTPKPADLDCEDGRYCTVGDRCNGQGTCVGGAATPCAVECQSVCNDNTRSCDPTSQGTPCTDDGLFCNGPETCNGAGVCQHSGNPCLETSCNHCQETTDRCFDPTSTSCDDNLFCNGADTCDGAGRCQHSGDPCPGTQCKTCQETPDSCSDPGTTACEDGNPCTHDDQCDGAGGCVSGAGVTDFDTDGHDAIACGGGDCDDNDREVNPDQPEGTECLAPGTCADGKDNDCDGDEDAADGNCPDADYICVDGPASPVSIATGGAAIGVRLRGTGHQTSEIVCYTDQDRLLPPTPVVSNAFETDFAGFTISDAGRVTRATSAQNPAATGSYGVQVCAANWLHSESIDTTGLGRIQLRFAASSESLASNMHFVVEYSPDDGATFYLVDLGNSSVATAYRWFTHILPPDAENISTLRIRFRLLGVGGSVPGIGHCSKLDDFSISAQPSPTLSHTLQRNHFEPSEGNTDAAADPQHACNGAMTPVVIAGFVTGGYLEKLCLDQVAQNPLTQANNRQGVLFKSNNAYLDTTIDTRFVPAGSDLIASYYMKSTATLDGFFALAAYGYGDGWHYAGAVGAGTPQRYDWFRAVMDPAARNRSSVVLRFWVPSISAVSRSWLDDYDLTWSRASHDRVGAFTSTGNGSYTATLTSDLVGTANVSCYYYGTSPPLLSDSSATVEFVP